MWLNEVFYEQVWIRFHCKLSICHVKRVQTHSQFNQADLVLNQSKPGSGSILPMLEREHFTLLSGIFIPTGTRSEFSEHSGK